ncbi:hypothetical protein A176_001936 [Myxococcus hansupus]|uniref:Lipoprotein n=1 Tax=Pseudomyxococcus hansupus TaxID=1297742 RepID=A0A0H4WQI7_9BACT|nr:hypothetical protein [Myxococcus hansupus]AKQ65024.1 hypothetical protein A176_001936 [Myxococcus hansupus]
MNVKALAAVVGTLSLASLATGCATKKSAEVEPATTEETGAESSGATEAQEGAPAATEEKGAEGSCGAGSCGAGSCNGQKKE